jgi:CheY-like chemotaxis protein
MTSNERSVDTSTAHQRTGERRRLWDRRSPAPRRTGQKERTAERRQVAVPVGAERRTGQDRRAGDRRTTAERRIHSLRRRRERRRTTPVPYMAEQLEELRADFAEPGPVTCPACGGKFTLGPARREGAKVERLVLCQACGRGTVIADSAAARVLLISAAAPLRQLLREMLGVAGHEVIEADDAGVGLDAYQTIPADVVVLDVVATGRLAASEFLRQLRASYPDSRVVVLAGRASFAGVDPLQIVGDLEGVRTLRVPVSRDALLATVKELRA